MPTSPPHKVWPILSIFRKLPIPSSVLDCGVGFGKYGVLLREYLDIRLQRYDKKDWKTTIDAIEIWPDYITPIHKYIYDVIYIGDILTISERLPNYDVIILPEIIEHLSKELGKKLLLTLYNKCNLGLSMSFPLSLSDHNRNDWPNPSEEHISLWSIEDLTKLFKDEVKPIGKLAYHIIKDS